jgi:hypothetical protein
VFLPQLHVCGFTRTATLEIRCYPAGLRVNNIVSLLRAALLRVIQFVHLEHTENYEAYSKPPERSG